MQGKPNFGIREISACGIWNPDFLESVIQLKDEGIPLAMPIQNPSSTDKQSGIQYLEPRIHVVESRIPDCRGFPYMGCDRRTKVVIPSWNIVFF